MQLVRRLRWFLLLALELFLLCEAKKKKSAASRRYGKRTDGVGTGVTTVFILLAVIFVPTITYFIYIVAKDPATPDILVALWNEFKVRAVGYLGRGTEKANSKVERSSRARRSRKTSIADRDFDE